MDTRRNDANRLVAGCMGPLFRHLARFDSMDSGSIEILQSLPQKSTFFARRSDIHVGSGVAPSALILVEGMAVSYKALDDGRRQVLSIIVPGDHLNLLISPLVGETICVQTLQDCRFIDISYVNVALINNNIGLLKALSASKQIENAIAHQWLIGLGRRTAEKRVAHLFCELYYRLRAVGSVDGDTYHLPLSLTDVADTVGLSTVHTCRAMRALAERKLFTRRRGRNVQIDIEGLSDVAAFDPAYLGPSVDDGIRCGVRSVTERSESALWLKRVCAGGRDHPSSHELL